MEQNKVYGKHNGIELMYEVSILWSKNAAEIIGHRYLSGWRHNIQSLMYITKVKNFSWFNIGDIAGNDQCQLPNHDNDFFVSLDVVKKNENNTPQKKHFMMCNLI